MGWKRKLPGRTVSARMGDWGSKGLGNEGARQAPISIMGKGRLYGRDYLCNIFSIGTPTKRKAFSSPRDEIYFNWKIK